MVITSKISLKTAGDADTHDITETVARAVAESGMTSGTVTVFCPGSTSGLTTIEYEEGAVADLQQVFDEVVPPDRYYRHNGGVTATATRTSEQLSSARLSPSPSSAVV